MQEPIDFNSKSLLFSLLLLLFFLSTSAEFADISSIQKQLRVIQLKLIGEKIKLIQGEVSQIQPVRMPSFSEESLLSRDELARRIEAQIATLESVVASLKPRAIVEETDRLEQRISQIREEIRIADGNRLSQLQEELVQIVYEYDNLQRDVTKSLEDTLKQKQVLVIQEQIKVLREKILMLPRETPMVVSRRVPQEDQTQLKIIEDAIQKAQLKLLQTQIRIMQDKINKVNAQ